MQPTTPAGRQPRRSSRASRLLVLGVALLTALATMLVTALAGTTTVASAATPSAATATVALPHHRVSLVVVVNRRAHGVTVVAMGKVSLRGVAGHRAFLQRWDRGHQRWVQLATTEVRANRHYRVRGRLAASAYVRVHLRGYGRAGDSKRVRVRVPVAPPAPTPTYASLTVDSTACVVRTADSSLRCWAYNQYGNVGDGTTTSPHPDTYQVPGAWRSVDTGTYTTCGIKTDGTAWCWGYNGYGALGDGTTTDRETPVQVGTDDDWTQVEAGYEASCGLRAGGAAYCWGTSSEGELGNGTTGGATSLTPSPVSGGHSFRKLAVDWYNACGLTTARTLLCWGYGGYGQNGNGGTSDQDTPTAVSLAGVTGATTWDSFSLNTYEACALTTDHVAYCWGYNRDGAVGNDTTTSVFEPTAVDVSGIGNPTWTSISTGYYNTCAVTTSGTTYCWGDNSYGELGDGTTTSTTAPSSASQVGGGHVWTGVMVGYSENCGIAQDTVYCWGYGGYGVLGTGSSASQSETPVAVAGL